jgi:hypothetical protein
VPRKDGRCQSFDSGKEGWQEVQPCESFGGEEGIMLFRWVGRDAEFAG